MDKVKKGLQLIKEGYIKKSLKELGWIYKLIGPFKSSVAMYSLLLLMSTGVTLWMSMQSRGLVDAFVSSEWNRISTLAVIYFLCGMAAVVLAIINQSVAGKTNAAIKADLSGRTYRKVMKADWECVIQHHSGDLLTRIQEDVMLVSQSTVGWIPICITCAIQIVFSFSAIVYYDYSMLLLVLVLAIPMVFGSRKNIQVTYKYNQLERDISSEIVSLFKESFQHLQSIKAFGLVDQFCSKIGRKIEERKTNDILLNRYNVLSWVFMYSSGQIAAFVCLGWALYRVSQGIISVGVLTLLVILAMNISSSFKSLIQQIPQGLKTISASERVRAILNLPEERIENEEVYQRMLEEAGDCGASVKVEHLNFSYASGLEVLRDVSYQVNSGEIVALVGPSGEGKTTMLRILLGIVHAENAPTLEVNGTVMPVSPAARRLMAYVPQGNTMLNGTIAENLRMFNQNATDEEIVTALKEACAYEFVEKLPDGIYHNIGESGIGFSEGQNQRLAIARALMCKTPILLLDEATSALDVATERRVLANLMQGVQKRTCILTTHRPSVLSMCDRVYRIANKQVMEIGEAEIQQVMNEF